MILNVGLQDKKLKLLSPAKEFLEAMKKKNILDAQECCDTLMKRQGVREKIPLIVVKVLVPGNWFNENKGPNKMSIFFIGPNNLLDDEESLLLALKLAERKDVADGAIRSLLKN